MYLYYIYYIKLLYVIYIYNIYYIYIFFLQEIQTSSFIAQALNGGNVSARYIPVITVIIGFFMAYCTGSVSVASHT